MAERTPIALTIAGSDSGGGAGIQADLKTFQAFGVFGTSAITAVTVQNTLGVHGYHAVPLATVGGQIRAVAEDLPPAACKTGMLATTELVRTVAACIDEFGLGNYVLDPVMVATSGDRLLDVDAEGTVVEALLPRATLVTPNLPEASVLLGSPVNTEAHMPAAAEQLVRMGASAALVKGGHLRSDEIVDVLFDGERIHEWRRPRLNTRHSHGTGCALSAAVTAGLALGNPLAEAIEAALDFVHRAMDRAPGLGAGRGPLEFGVEARSVPR